MVTDSSLHIKHFLFDLKNIIVTIIADIITISYFPTLSLHVFIIYIIHTMFI